VHDAATIIVFNTADNIILIFIFPLLTIIIDFVFLQYEKTGISGLTEEKEHELTRHVLTD